MRMKFHCVKLKRQEEFKKNFFMGFAEYFCSSERPHEIITKIKEDVMNGLWILCGFEAHFMD